MTLLMPLSIQYQSLSVTIPGIQNHEFVLPVFETYANRITQIRLNVASFDSHFLFF